MTNSASESQALKRIFTTQAVILGGLVAVMWGLEILDIGMGGRLDYLGIWPRQSRGLTGILVAPLLHGGFRHLISNTFPFLVLGWLIMAADLGEWVVVSAVAGLVSGLGTWIFGSNGVHIGASGVIFGYFGFLLARAFFERTMGSFLVAFIVLAMFGGMIWGILPIRVGISWEGHLFGLVGGIAAAWLIGWIKKKTN
ncbi:rhomboid family intramembrane serine protease [filamentous cyanobacterium LEGE 11480]|uniref:Rhomboid family intramembrane serine protease n=1 Tax=Romeriopsis navalis LEGE 11480 TaxID=2777977 RepID=A0A928VI32_9CYAN|nr:rhomboid family intramembrane serine protease [Romeriopsis navalis]MBE9028740.1 rhomboid family intramembrane serine protease [Romeriopsis navalis LEGE 11480]